MSENAPGSRVGTLFGHYRLRRLLGRGGMGEVYEAEDTVKDRVVALKLMTQGLSADPVFRQRMQREAQTAGRLQEPHIVPIHDYGEIDGQLFIDMRFIRGTDVKRLLAQGGPFPPARAIAIIGQIAAALTAAHSAGVIHRDVKPENILVTGEDFAYLVDFGIAAAFTDQQRLTKTGTTIGSWNYMAPECFDDEESTYRVDIYALACVLHECLTGTTPYPTDSLPALMTAHLNQPIPQPSRHNPAISTDFDDVIARGMAKTPTDRYTSAEELAVAAHHALSASDQQRAATLFQHSQQFAPPLTTALPRTEPPPWRPTPPPPRGKGKPWLILGAAGLAIIALVAGVGIWQATRHTGGGRHATSTTTVPATTTTRSTSAAPLPIVAPAQLNSILLTPAAINPIMGASNIQQVQNKTKMDETPTTLSKPDCAGALFPAYAPAYAGSGYTGVSFMLLQEPETNFEHAVDQAAVTFASPDQASAYVTAAAAKWKTCADQTITENDAGGRSGAWIIGSFSGDPPKIAMPHKLQSGNGWACQRALSAVSNVVVDVYACGFRITDQARQIADAIATNVAK